MKRKRILTFLLAMSMCLSGCGGCGKKEEVKEKIANDFRSGIMLARDVIESANDAVDTVLSSNEEIKAKGLDFFKNNFFDGMILFDNLDEDLFCIVEYLNEDSMEWSEVEEKYAEIYKKKNQKINVKRLGEDKYTIELTTEEDVPWLKEKTKISTVYNCVYDPNHGWTKVNVIKTGKDTSVEAEMFEFYREGDIYVIQTEDERFWIEFEKEESQDKKKEVTWTVKDFVYSKLDPTSSETYENALKFIENPTVVSEKKDEEPKAEEKAPAEGTPGQEAAPAPSSAAPTETKPEESKPEESKSLEERMAQSSESSEFNKYVNPDFLNEKTINGYSEKRKYSSNNSVFQFTGDKKEWVTQQRNECAIVIEYSRKEVELSEEELKERKNKPLYEESLICYNRNKINYKVEKWVIKDNVTFCFWGNDMSPLTSSELSQVESELSAKEESSSSSEENK